MAKWYRLIFLSSLFIFIILQSCDREKKVSIEYLEEIASNQFVYQETPAQITPPYTNIVVDISESMRGFAVTGSMQDLVRRLITRIGNQANIRHYKFDANLSRLDDPVELFNPNLYTGLTGNIANAFSLREEGDNGVMIIITDLQFNNIERYLELVELFQQKRLQNEYIKVFSIRTDFSGRIFPQFISPRQIYTYNGKRPLYVITISHRQYNDFVENVLGQGMQWENIATICNNVPLDWRIVNSNAFIISDKHLSRRTSDSLSVTIRARSPLFNEWNDLTKDNINVNAYSFKDSIFSDLGIPVIIRNIKKDSDTITMTFWVGSVNPSPPKLFRVYIRPKNVPMWVKEQSTSPQGDQAQYTLMFDNFIEDMMGPVYSPFTLASINIYFKKE